MPAMASAPRGGLGSAAKDCPIKMEKDETEQDDGAPDEEVRARLQAATDVGPSAERHQEIHQSGSRRDGSGGS